MNVKEMKLSKLGFGMMRLPGTEQEIDIPQLCNMVDAYMDKGMNYFDTAYMYCFGKSESAVKEAIVNRYPRDSFYLATKLPSWMMQGKDDRDRIFNDQLERTGAGYFDFYLLHSVEDGANYENYIKYDCFNWGIQKKAEGLIKHFGFSFHGTPELLDKILADHPEVEFVQIQLNYADWTNPLVQSAKLYEVLRKYDMPILVMEPVKGGTLANVNPSIEELFRNARPDSSVASWALRFVASLEGVTTVLSGMSNEEQMNDNLKTFSHFEPLSEQEQELIWKAAELLHKMPTVPCTECRYCMDGCPMGIAIPDIFKSLNALRMYGEDMRPHFFYDNLISEGKSARAKECIQCGQCEGVCPQHLPIIEYLQEASEKLDIERKMP